MHNRKATAGAVILVIFALVAILAPVIAPGDPTDFVDRPHLPPSTQHLFGTSGQGQDVFTQTVWGSRPTLAVGLLVGILTTVAGIVVGLSAGYFGGIVDDLLSLMTNVFLIVPSLPLLVVLAAFLGSGNVLYFVLVLTVTGWAWPARVLRSQTLALREKDFVAAARVGGESGARIIFSEILPNMLSIVVASFLGSTIFAIGALAALEFLGLGNPSVVSWGTNLYWASNNAGLLTGAWWTFVPAGACIALVAFAFALVNYAIDEITNPRLRAKRESAGALKQIARPAASTRATPVVRHAG
jgi:peptide/nickel transport system permease protein